MRRHGAHVELRRLPLLRHANRGLALDRFADLARRSDIPFKGGLKRAQCDGIAIGCTWPELQFFPDILGQLFFGNTCIESYSCGCGRRITTSIGIQLF